MRLEGTPHCQAGGMLPLALKLRGIRGHAGKARTMTPAELREALAYFSEDEKVAVRFVAGQLDVYSLTIRSWLQGRAPVPGPAAVAIKLLCELYEPLKPPMTPEQLDEAIDELYDHPLVSQRQFHLAVDLGVSPSAVLSWLGRQRPMQGPTRAAIQLMLKKKRLERRSSG